MTDAIITTNLIQVSSSIYSYCHLPKYFVRVSPFEDAVNLLLTFVLKLWMSGHGVEHPGDTTGGGVMTYSGKGTEHGDQSQTLLMRQPVPRCVSFKYDK